MTQLDKFQRYLNNAGVVYFSAREVFFRGGSDAQLKLNSDPPEELWPKIIPTLLVLDEARRHVGPLILTSVYRNRAYNKAISGAPKSLHMEFSACDVQPHPLTADKVSLLYIIVIRLRQRGMFKGGVGRYSTFIHVDTRGYNADF